MSCAVFFISLPSFIGGLHGYSFQLLGDITALFVFVSEWVVGWECEAADGAAGGGVAVTRTIPRVRDAWSVRVVVKLVISFSYTFSNEADATSDRILDCYSSS